MIAPAKSRPKHVAEADNRRHGLRPAAELGADVEALVEAIVSRRPSIGLAVGVVRGGRLEFFRGHGLADIASNAAVDEDTVFRIGSITKTVTAIAVMQLWERALVDLDAPAGDYLRAFELVPARLGIGQPTVRQLLTHSAGIPDLRRLTDLLHAGLTPSDGRPPLLSVEFGHSLPSLAEYYRDGLRVVVEPGSAFAYSNHGWAALGQIVEDVSGQPLDRYFRDHIFEPLGMTDSDLVRSERIAARLATGYVLRARGARAVPDRDWIGAAAGGVYSTSRDLARYAAALLGGGANDHGRVLDAATLATMFEPHYQSDRRLPGMGLGFFLGDVGGHRVAMHDGILPGFNSELLVAPADGVGVFALTNGSSGAFAWLQIELEGLLRGVIGLANHDDTGGAPHHPELWAELSGRYVFPPIADLRERLLLGGGAEVFVRDGRLNVRVLTAVPALYRGLPLEPTDRKDPYLFRLDLSGFGMAPVRVVFSPVIDGRAMAVHTDLGGQPWTMVRAPDVALRRRLIPAAAGLVAVAAALRWRRAAR